MLIFSYGSNMYSKRIKKRIQSAEYYGIGQIKKHKLFFHKKSSKDNSGKADCYFTDNEKDFVWGVVYKIDPNEKILLDKYEGLNKGYLEKEGEINLQNKTTIKAIFYYANNNYINKSLKPYGWYLQLVKVGAKENCLPLSYQYNILNKVISIVDKDSNRINEAKKILPMENYDTKLGGYRMSDWKNLRELLNENSSYDSNWELAISYFKSRINTRYIEPIKKIEVGYTGEGFSIMPALCILIELMAAFKYGKIHNPLKRGEKPEYEYRESDKFFKKFLISENAFEGYFHSKDNSKPLLCADDFYKNVRCALIHEACTKNNWLINTNHNPKIIDKTKAFQVDGELIKRINRNALFRLIIEMCSYKRS